MEDGTQQQVRSRGDEFFNWTEDANGFAVIRGVNGRWQHALRNRGRWVPAGMQPPQRGLEGRALDPPSRVSPFDGASAVTSSASGTLPSSAVAALAATPSPAKLLVVLVSFADCSISSDVSGWTNKFFGASGKTINSFYQQASKNRFLFNPPDETQGTINDGLISVTLAINHPNTATTDDTVRNAVKAALIAADPYINFKSFDTDGNGLLSGSELHLVLIFAGYEASYSASYTPLIWAHRWSLSGTVTAPTLDGVSVGSLSGGYMAVGENHATHAATIGVICHELGHNLGLPDLYDTDGSSDGVGTHCLMGAGSWGAAAGDSYAGQTPVLPSAYCRQAIGFSDVLKAVGEGTACTLTQISDSTSLADMLRINTPNSQQYFLIENRQLTGFDAGLYYYLGVSSGGGLAIWHIDESAAGNATDTRRLVDMEEAASPALDAPGWPLGRLQNYYYAGGVTRFDETTAPSNTLNGGVASLARVYNVSSPAAQMSFTADEGASLEAALDTGAAQAVTTGGSANWVLQTAITHDGVDAVQSGAINRSSKMSWIAAVANGPATVTFWWKHAAAATETLKFFVDGVQQASTGTTDWFQQRRQISSGAHTLRWEFSTTRSSGSFSLNQAYLDQLSITSPTRGTSFNVH
ncbi:MAG: M6 family metalloprotease domain-containing protein [bacterium]